MCILILESDYNNYKLEVVIFKHLLSKRDLVRPIYHLLGAVSEVVNLISSDRTDTWP